MPTNQYYLDNLRQCDEYTISENPVPYILQAIGETLKVYPTENYYYFNVPYCGNIYKGNLHFNLFFDGKKKRKNVILAFENYKNITLGSIDNDNLAIITWEYTDKDKELLNSESPKFTYKLNSDSMFIVKLLYRGKIYKKFVYFEQVPKRTKPVPPSSIFISNTIDESGFVFSLIFDTMLNQFLWLMNDNQMINFKYIPVNNFFLIEPISGFVFLKTEFEPILIGVPVINVAENNWWDGPFDQSNEREWSPLFRKFYLKIYPQLKDSMDYYMYSKSNNYKFSVGNYIHYYDLKFLDKLESKIKDECNKSLNYICLAKVFIHFLNSNN